MSRRKSGRSLRCEVDYEAVVGKIIVILTPLFRSNISDKEFLDKTEETMQFLHEVWSNWEAQIQENRANPPLFNRAAIARAKEAFGGYCLICRLYKTKHSCPPIDKNLPGCIEYSKKISKKEQKREKILDVFDTDSSDPDDELDEV